MPITYLIGNRGSLTIDLTSYYVLHTILLVQAHTCTYNPLPRPRVDTPRSHHLLGRDSRPTMEWCPAPQPRTGQSIPAYSRPRLSLQKGSPPGLPSGPPVESSHFLLVPRASFFSPEIVAFRVDTLCDARVNARMQSQIFATLVISRGRSAGRRAQTAASSAWDGQPGSVHVLLSAKIFQLGFPEFVGWEGRLLLLLAVRNKYLTAHRRCIVAGCIQWLLRLVLVPPKDPIKYRSVFILIQLIKSQRWYVQIEQKLRETAYTFRTGNDIETA